MSQLTALLSTIAIEVAVALIVLSRVDWVRGTQRWWRSALAVAAASLVTHPAAWWLSQVGLAGWPYEVKVVAIEGGVIVVEALIIGIVLGLRTWHALLLSALTNAASFSIGLLVVRTISR